MHFTSLNLAEFEKIATTIAKGIEKPLPLLLYGDLGAGKTTFSRAFIQALCGKEAFNVVSPTFTLVQTYPSPQGDIWHADLYRLQNPAEVEELGLLEAFNQNICLIEWPQNLGPYKPTQGLALTITVQPSGARDVALEML
jgi:tRNA threonylcarbamoyl adenosine modification protein YjeE